MKTAIMSGGLRIGNWFTRIHGKGHTDVQIDLDILSKIFSDDPNIAFDDFEPIRLTQDWLKKLELESLCVDDDMYRYGKNRLIVEWVFGGYTARLKINDSESLFIKEIEYVHDLQNLDRELTQ